MLYEITDHDRQYAINQSIILEYDALLPREEVEYLIIKAQCAIEEYIETSDDDSDQQMSVIAELYLDVSALEAIVEYLCVFNGFNRYHTPETITVYIN